ncbi:acyl-homoserine-lactone synthase [Shimia ponticola]|uniref:acyl-homoserine-lactone synthase n=1 Tax=Shimia ponticola TaxID=2582893 RepID=UPI0011BE7D10|nr:acyl-homoserine-lactone synthase [Shimia ponticola]
MIRFVYADQLTELPKLRETMHMDRAWQFKTRLKWDVAVDKDGWESDAYDALNPLYVIWQLPDGAHGGSMRLLPTTSNTMVNDHFLHLTDGVRIESPKIWECTRFCLGPRATPQTAAALMLAGGEVLQGFGLTSFVGVFDARMVRIYKRIGASPEVLGSQGKGRDAISVGLWGFDAAAQARVARQAGLGPQIVRHWFNRAFGHVMRQAA